MVLPIIAVVVGLVVLTWSADKFVGGAAAAARQLGMSPLLIGMLIIGFGTSAPEIVVSIIAAIDGSPSLALGNAYGSNITNIALILGLTAILLPVAVDKSVMRREIPALLFVTLLSAYAVWDDQVSRIEGGILIAILFAMMGWSIYDARKKRKAVDEEAMLEELDVEEMSLKMAVVWIVVGMLLLVASSRGIVWGAVEIARAFGVSDLVIGLTVVAIGTSMPELASSVAAARKGEDDMVLGNIIGSNLFNTLAVVGIAAVIKPIAVESVVITRDVPVMTGLVLALILFGSPIWGGRKIGRFSGVLFVATYVAYTVYLVWSSFLGV